MRACALVRACVCPLSPSLPLALSLSVCLYVCPSRLPPFSLSLSVCVCLPLPPLSVCVCAGATQDPTNTTVCGELKILDAARRLKHANPDVRVFVYFPSSKDEASIQHYCGEDLFTRHPEWASRSQIIASRGLGLSKWCQQSRFEMCFLRGPSTEGRENHVSNPEHTFLLNHNFIYCVFQRVKLPNGSDFIQRTVKSPIVSVLPFFDIVRKKNLDDVLFTQHCWC